MDDKIINELDNLDEAATEQLLNSIERYEAVDKDTANRIKSSALSKAGINRNFKSPLIPNKLRFYAGCFAITLIELLFFTVFAFVAWMDGFLEKSGINMSFGGIVPVVIYVFMFAFLSLSVYLAMYRMDDKRFYLKNVIPKSRTFLAYFLYFILSAGIKLFLLFINYKITEYLSEYLPERYADTVFVIFEFFISLMISFTFADVLLSKLKSWIITRSEGLTRSPFNWHISIKSLLIELLKYSVITGTIIILGLLNSFFFIINGNIGIAPIITGVFIMYIFNLFFSILVLLKKRNYMKITPTGDEETTDRAPQMKSGTRWIYFKQRAVLAGFLGAAFLYAISLSIPYVGQTSFKSEKPLLVAFTSKDATAGYFADRKLPFNVPSNSVEEVNELTEYLYNINKMLTGIVCLNPSFSFGNSFGGTLNAQKSRSDAAPANFAGRMENGRTATFTGDGFSKTNTQVENVDEADVIKTNGEYMYYLSQSKLFIVRANPPELMKIIYQYDFTADELNPTELFLYKKHLAVILTSDNNSTKTVVKTYNIEDPSNPKIERNFKLNFTYLTARMIENHLYLVSTTSTSYGNQMSPEYFDSAKSDSTVEIDYRNLYFMRGSAIKDYTNMNVVAAFPIDDPRREAQVKGYIGGNGENVYVSNKHIYITESSEDAYMDTSLKDFLNNLTSTDSDNMEFYKYGTDIYRIGISNGAIDGFDSAFVSGLVKNQFSMDEYDGYFRLATQTGNFRYASSNVYVLDENMKLCGSLEGLAPKENIYASRFMGDRLYLVTFKKVDPLFVISLKNPKDPTVLGKLKIPGYSEYIHPLDENHIIGFGKDTAGGNEDFSWYQGIKMAIFDVTDVKNPKEKFVEIIGDRGTDSELLRNHKALMYMKEPGIMAFPVSVAKVHEGAYDNEYGSIVFQGAYIYNVSSNAGFKLRGKITHMDQTSDYGLKDMYDETNDDYINRIIYANESLYTFSGGKVKSTRYNDMKDVSEISLTQR